MFYRLKLSSILHFYITCNLELFFVKVSVVKFASCRTANIKDGTIKMNGKERNLSQFRKLSAYIMQDNQLHGNLTVEEAMTVATSLKLSTKVPKEEKVVVVSVRQMQYSITLSGSRLGFVHKLNLI